MRAAQGAAVAVAQAPAAAATAQSVPRAVAAAAAPAAAPAAAASVGCPQCGHVNAPSNKFCASCGYTMVLVGGAPAAGASPAMPVAAPVAGSGPGQVMLTALRADGTEAGNFALPGPLMTVGRDVGGIFAGDSYLSPRHATFSVRGNKLFIKDELSLNGVYLKVAPESPLELLSRDCCRIGQEIICV